MLFSYSAVTHARTLAWKQPESRNSHETEGERRRVSVTAPPTNPCNETGQYSGAPARPALIGQQAEKKGGRPLSLISL